jgi:hypothetical protein
MKRLFMLILLAGVMMNGVFAQKTDINLKTFVPVDKVIELNTTITNEGSEAINSFNIHYSVSNRQVITETVENVNILSGEKFDYTFKTPWTPQKAGEFHDVKVWTSGINGVNSQNNEPAELKVLVNNGLSANKEVFVEMLGSVNDGNCPDGYYKMDELVKNAGINGAVYHISSKLFTFEGNDIVARMNLNTNQGMVDRTVFSGQTDVGLERDQWSAKATERLNEIVPVDIDITDVDYDYNTQFMTVETDIKFVDDAYGLIRVAALLTEDGVYNQNEYDYQQNNYNNVSGHPYFGVGDSFNNLPFNMVMRGYLTNMWGRDIDPFRPNGGHFPKDSVASYSFTMFIDKFSWKLNDLNIYVLVTYYDGADNSKMEILNVKKYDFVSSVEDDGAKDYQLTVYPNPVTNIANIAFSLDKNSQVQLTVFNSMGQMVETSGLRKYAKGENNYYLNTADYPQGVYIGVLDIEGQKYSVRFIK